MDGDGMLGALQGVPGTKSPTSSDVLLLPSTRRPRCRHTAMLERECVLPASLVHNAPRRSAQTHYNVHQLTLIQTHRPAAMAARRLKSTLCIPRILGPPKITLQRVPRRSPHRKPSKPYISTPHAPLHDRRPPRMAFPFYGQQRLSRTHQQQRCYQRYG